MRRVSYRNYIPARYQNPKQQLLIIAAEPYDWVATTDDLTIAPEYVDALARSRTGAIVGKVLAQKYGWKIGQRIPLQSDVLQKNRSTTWTFEIVGLLELPIRRGATSRRSCWSYETRSETWREASQSQFKALGDLAFVARAIMFRPWPPPASPARPPSADAAGISGSFRSPSWGMPP